MASSLLTNIGLKKLVTTHRVTQNTCSERSKITEYPVSTCCEKTRLTEKPHGEREISCPAQPSQLRFQTCVEESFLPPTPVKPSDDLRFS